MHGSGYYNCDTLCEGKVTDLYYNKKVRIEGNFIHGIPIGELRFYQSDGSLERIENIIKRVSLKGLLISNLRVDYILIK